MELEEIWRIREGEVYPKLFGPNGRGIFTLNAELFTGTFRQTEIDPLWLFYGVFEFAPTEDRPSWLYVTSGHSNPWEWDEKADSAGPDAESGAGIEFLFATTQQGNWAISYLQNMLAYDLLLSADRFPGGTPIGVGDRIPLNSPINSKADCALRNAIVSTTDALPAGFTLPSGTVVFLTFTGVTDAEISSPRQTALRRLLSICRRPELTRSLTQPVFPSFDLVLPFPDPRPKARGIGTSDRFHRNPAAGRLTSSAPSLSQQQSLVARGFRGGSRP